MKVTTLQLIVGTACFVSTTTHPNYSTGYVANRRDPPVGLYFSQSKMTLTSHRACPYRVRHGVCRAWSESVACQFDFERADANAFGPSRAFARSPAKRTVAVSTRNSSASPLPVAHRRRTPHDVG